MSVNTMNSPVLMNGGLQHTSTTSLDSSLATDNLETAKPVLYSQGLNSWITKSKPTRTSPLGRSLPDSITSSGNANSRELGHDKIAPSKGVETPQDDSNKNASTRGWLGLSNWLTGSGNRNLPSSITTVQNQVADFPVKPPTDCSTLSSSSLTPEDSKLRKNKTQSANTTTPKDNNTSLVTPWELPLSELFLEQYNQLKRGYIKKDTRGKAYDSTSFLTSPELLEQLMAISSFNTDLAADPMQNIWAANWQNQPPKKYIITEIQDALENGPKLIQNRQVQGWFLNPPWSYNPETKTNLNSWLTMIKKGLELSTTENAGWLLIPIHDKLVTESNYYKIENRPGVRALFPHTRKAFLLHANYAKYDGEKIKQVSYLPAFKTLCLLISKTKNYSFPKIDKMSSGPKPIKIDEILPSTSLPKNISTRWWRPKNINTSFGPSDFEILCSNLKLDPDNISVDYSSDPITEWTTFYGEYETIKNIHNEIKKLQIFNEINFLARTSILDNEVEGLTIKLTKNEKEKRRTSQLTRINHFGIWKRVSQVLGESLGTWIQDVAPIPNDAIFMRLRSEYHSDLTVHQIIKSLFDNVGLVARWNNGQLIGKTMEDRGPKTEPHQPTPEKVTNNDEIKISITGQVTKLEITSIIQSITPLISITKITPNSQYPSLTSYIAKISDIQKFEEIADKPIEIQNGIIMFKIPKFRSTPPSMVEKPQAMAAMPIQPSTPDTTPPVKRSISPSSISIHSDQLNLTSKMNLDEQENEKRGREGGNEDEPAEKTRGLNPSNS